MKKEDLMALGLTEEQAEKVLRAVEGNYIPKTRFDEAGEETKALKKSLSDRDKQLETLKKSSGDNAELQKQISDLQQQNEEQKKVYEAELSQLRLDNAVELSLSGAKARNSKAVKAMIDMAKVKLGEDGKLTGLDEQVEALKKSDGYLFEALQTGPSLKGFQPGASTGAPDPAAAGYETRLADARKNHNQVEVIRIKQEAADNGVILM